MDSSCLLDLYVMVALFIGDLIFEEISWRLESTPALGLSKFCVDEDTYAMQCEMSSSFLD